MTSTIDRFVSGIVFFANPPYVLIATCGHNVKAAFLGSFFGDVTTFEIHFAELGFNPNFDGVSLTGYSATLLSDVEDANNEIAILTCVYPFFDNVPRFREDPVQIGMKVCSCANTYGYDRFSFGEGHVSSVRSSVVVGHDPHNLVSSIEYFLPLGSGSSGAAICDSSGKIVAIHISVEAPGGIPGMVFQGIPIRFFKTALQKLCHSVGVNVSIVEDAYVMSDLLVGAIFGTNLLTSGTFRSSNS